MSTYSLKGEEAETKSPEEEPSSPVIKREAPASMTKSETDLNNSIGVSFIDDKASYKTALEATID